MVSTVIRTFYCRKLPYQTGANQNMSSTFAFQKPDMDTVLSAVILGFDSADPLIECSPEASKELLARPEVYCIECGGSGQVDLRNFDHHDTHALLPPACVQAYSFKGCSNTYLLQLVKYVQWVDEGRRFSKYHCQEGLYLSNVYSGMLLMYESSILEQFYHGVQLFKHVIEKKIDPWKPVPKISEWSPYFHHKNLQRQQLEKYASQINYYQTNSGLTAGYLCANLPGTHALLRRSGCTLSIAAGLSKQNDLLYTTISSNQLSMLKLLPEISRIEKGWGGPCHGNIIASPKKGTCLSERDLVTLVCNFF